MTIGRMTNRFVIFALIIFSAPSYMAAALSTDVKGDKEALSLLLDTFAHKKYKKVGFYERKSSPLLVDAIEMSGEMFFRHPGYLLKEIHEPHQERFELENGKLGFQREGGEVRTLDVENYPLLNAFTTGYTAVLNGNPVQLQKFYRLEFEQRDYAWRLTLHPRTKAMKEHIIKIEFVGDHDTIRTIHVYEAGGDISTTTFHDQGLGLKQSSQ